MDAPFRRTWRPRGPSGRSGSLLTAVLGALALGGCAATHLDATWRASGTPAAPYRAPAIFGVADNAKVRRAYEDTFVATLNGLQLGVHAQAGHRLLPGSRLSSTADFERAARVSGADCILMTHLAGGTGEAAAGSDPPPAADRDLYTYYARIRDDVSDPDYYRDARTLRLETNLYDARRETLVWSGRSAPLDPASDQVRISDVLSQVILELRGAGLLP